jgi:hypothetical protein
VGRFSLNLKFKLGSYRALLPGIRLNNMPVSAARRAVQDDRCRSTGHLEASFQDMHLPSTIWELDEENQRPSVA